MRNRKYRRVIPTNNSKLQGYQYTLIALLLSLLLSVLTFLAEKGLTLLSDYLLYPLFFFIFTALINTLLLIHFWSKREKVSHISIPSMSYKTRKIANQIRRLFSDKQITDVLKLSNHTRFGHEMPEIKTWIDEELLEGFIAIENIANFERANKEQFEQRISGILAGEFQRFSVIHSELSKGDSYIIFHFEDVLTSKRIFINNRNSLNEFVCENRHAIRLSNDLIWNTQVTPMLSIIARTRSGKSIFAGKYIAPLMVLQGWIVEYNSAKYDRYVKEFNGQSDPEKIVERAEYWCSIMDSRLKEINESGKDTYSEMENMPDIGLFFDELGNFNAALDSLDKVDKTLKLTSRWIAAINRLTATGGSSGIHIIAISQFATKEGFLPSLARVNCSDAVIMLGGAADSAEERKYLMSGFADLPKRSYMKGQGLARIIGSGKKWEVPHFFETPWFE
nr:MAG TPA: ESX-5 secretion system protein EccC5, MOTOR PROTEIN [Caudoviricetes sp.]